MKLRILLPSQVHLEETPVSSIVAQTPEGSFGILPQRLDCVAALSAGILSYATSAGALVHVAVDAGVLVKTGDDVLVSVRQAVDGADLASLHQQVQEEIRRSDDQQLEERSASARLEGDLLRRLSELPHGR
jgi:F-type H+-transporting ATPase subunit epsilon